LVGEVLVLDAVAVLRDDHKRVIVALLDRGELLVESHVDRAVREFLQVRLRDVAVVVAKQHVGAVDQRDLGREAGEDVRELGGDVASADDDETARQLVDAHDGVGGVDAVGGLRQAGHVEGPGPRAGGDDDVRRGDPRVADLQRRGVDEAGLAVEDRDVLAALAPVEAAGGDGVDAAEDPVADRRPVGVPELELHTKPACLGDARGEVRGQHEHLGGDAAAVEAGAAERLVALDQGDIPVGEPFVDERVPGPGTDDGEVEVLHAAILSRRARAPPEGGRRSLRRPAVLPTATRSRPGSATSASPTSSRGRSAGSSSASSSADWST